MTLVTEQSAHPHPHAIHQHPYPHSHPNSHCHSPANLSPHVHVSPHRNEHDRDVHGLRLYLGSILSPKRYTPTSRPASGTASPCPAHFGPGFHSYVAASGSQNLHTPVETHDTESLMPPHPAASEARTPFNHSVITSATPSPSPSPKRALSTAYEENSAGHIPPVLTTYDAHEQEHQQSLHPAAEARLAAESAAAVARKKDKERAVQQQQQQQHTHGFNAYIATLQSKHAWDALVHGNMQ